MILPPLTETRDLTPEQQKLEQDLSQCVRCAVCLPTCPTYQLTLDEGHSPRGRISLVRAMHEGMAEPSKGMHDFLDACLQCRACETACPNNVEFHKVIAYGKDQIHGDKYRGFWGRRFKNFFLNNVFASNRKFDRFMSLIRLYQKSGLQWLMRKTHALHLLPWKLGKLERMLPEGPGKHRPLRKKQEQLLIPSGEIRGSVNFFSGCIADHWLQASAHAAVRTLLRLGFQVRIPAHQHCCGALHEHLGDTGGATQLSEKNMAAFAGNSDPIVLHAAGCGAMLKEYPELLKSRPDPQVPRAFSARIIDFSQLLANHQHHLRPDIELRKSILDYYVSTDWLDGTVANNNEIIEDVVRPFFAEQKLLNYGNQIIELGGNLNLVNDDRFYSELQHEELQQVLFESGIKLSIMLRNAERTLEKNSKLKHTITTYLESQ